MNNHHRTVRPFRACRSGVAGALTALVATLCPLPAQASPAESPFVFVKAIDYVNEAGGPVAPPQNLVVDAQLRRLVSFGSKRLFLLDLDRLEQAAVPGQEAAQPRGVMALGGFGAATLALDAQRHRVFLGEQTNPTGLATTDLTTSRRLLAVSLVGEFARPAPVTLPQAFVGSEILALSYSAIGDVVLLATSFAAGSVPNNDAQSAASTAAGVTLHAYQAEDLVRPTAGVAPLWTYDVEGCPQLVRSTGAQQPFLGVGATGDFVFFACRGTNTPAGQATPHGVVRIDLKHADPGQQDPEQFEADFHPLAGDLTNGVSAGIPGSNRILVFTSSAGNQRAFVFDALRRAWTGSVPLSSGNVHGSTADPTRGRVYTVQGGDSVRVVDAGPVPATQGNEYSMGAATVQVRAHPAVDPVTRRVFIVNPTVEGRSFDVGVFEDRSAPFREPDARDPDGATHDIDEASAVNVAFGGGAEKAGAFGLRAFVVGGFEGATTAAPLSEIPFFPEALRPEPGNRGLFVARVSGAQLRGDADGSQASAQAVGASLDDATRSDLEGKTEFTNLTPRYFPLKPAADATVCEGGAAAACEEFYEGYSSLDKSIDKGLEEGPITEDEGSPDTTRDGLEDVPSVGETTEEVVGHLKISDCRDYGGDDQERSNPGSAVACDADANRVTAVATSDDAALPALPVTIASADAKVSVVKDPEAGVVTTAESVVRGVDILGVVQLGEVRSRAITRARGRPGTAVSDHSTAFNAVRVRSPLTGETVFACGMAAGVDDPEAKCDPAQVVQEINNVAPLRFKVFGPRRELDARIAGSPGGAQAIVYEDPFAYWSDFNVNFDGSREVPALQVVFYNDTDLPSRLVVQFAATQAESHYEIGAMALPLDLTPAAEDEAIDAVVIPRLAVAGVRVEGRDPKYLEEIIFANAVDASEPSPDPGLLRRLFGAPLDGLRLLARNWAEALLVAGVWAILALPLWLRRRRGMLNDCTGGMSA